VTGQPTLVLGSASPARLKTLRAAGLDAEVIVSGVDESVVEATRGDELAGVLARMKAEAVAARLLAEPSADRRLVIGCDSVLDFHGTVYGKPADAADAVRRWQKMRGRSGVLHTGHCVLDVAAGAASTGVAALARAQAVAGTVVHFADIDDAEIEAYVATGEPLAVAGAFTIDGLGGPFVERIEGDPGTVVGLSLPLLRRLLAQLGVRVTDLWRPAG